MRRIVSLASAVVLSVASIGRAVPADAAVEHVSNEDRTITIPAGTAFRLRVTRGFGSDFSRVEDPVSATLAQAVTINGRTVLPAGSAATGYVAEATRPGRVKGRGRVAVRFTRITPAHESRGYAMQTRRWTAVAPATKKDDALKRGCRRRDHRRQEGRSHRRRGRRRRQHRRGVDDARERRARRPWRHAAGATGFAADSQGR
jgi:hypothetical protein